MMQVEFLDGAAGYRSGIVTAVALVIAVALVQSLAQELFYMLWAQPKKKKKRKVTQLTLFTKQKQTHRHRKQTYGYQRGKEMGKNKLGIWD